MIALFSQNYIDSNLDDRIAAENDVRILQNRAVKVKTDLLLQRHDMLQAQLGAKQEIAIMRDRKSDRKQKQILSCII